MGIIASPHKNGNSSAIVDSVIVGAMGLSTDIFEMVHLNNMKFINGCQACMGCKKLGKCIVKDDVSEILDKIADSDSVIFSTPVYFGRPSAQYAILEDRMFSFIGPNNSLNISPGKKAVVVVTAGEQADADRVAESMCKNLTAFGFDVVGKIAYAGDGAKDNSELMSKAIELGKKVAKHLPDLKKSGKL